MVSKKKLDCIKKYEEGLLLYRQKQFKKALNKFEEALNIDPNDSPSKVFIDRCKDLQNKTISDNWDGVYNLKVK